MSLPAGIYKDVSALRYHADPCEQPSLSSSIGKILLRSPQKAQLAHPRLNPNFRPLDRKEFDLGTTAHDLLLEGGTAKICVIEPEMYRSKGTKENPDGNIPDGWTNNAIRAARDQAYANNLVPMLPWDHARVKTMIDVAREFLAKSQIAGVFERGAAEQTVIWQEKNGVWCRSRLDLLTDSCDYLIDFKTTKASAHPDEFGRQIERMGYDFQGMFYSRGVTAVSGKTPEFVLLVQEEYPPYQCCLHGLSGAMMEMAESNVKLAIERWGECLNTKTWPGYPTRIVYQEPSSWRLNEWMTRQEMEEGEA